MQAAVEARLADAGVRHRTEIVRGKITPWVLAVHTNDGVIDDLFGVPGSQLIGIVPRYLEDVSIELATEYVAMCCDLLPESRWWQLFDAEQAAAAQLRRELHRAKWRRWFGRSQ